MNVYIASKFGNRLLIRLLIETGFFKDLGLEINSSWLYKEEAISFSYDIVKDFKEIDECDFLIAPYYWIDGAKNEICYAMGKNKPIIVLIDDISFSGHESVCVNDYSTFFPLAKFQYISEFTSSEVFFNRENCFIIAEDTVTFKNAIRIVKDIVERKQENNETNNI